MFWGNVRRRIRNIILLLENAEQKGISNKTKSSYYRAAMILACTLVEGMVYELARKSTIGTDHVVGDRTEHKEKHPIPSAIFGTANHHCICEKVKTIRHLDDKGFDFSEMNMFLRNKRIIPISVYENLEWVRKERNKIHIQGLTGKDTGYTKAKIDRTAGAFGFLIGKVSAIK